MVPRKIWYSTHDLLQALSQSSRAYFFQLFTGVLQQNNLSQKYSAQQIYENTYFWWNVNLSKRVGMDGVFLELAGRLLGISLGLRPREILRSSPASPRNLPSIPPLLLGLTQYHYSARPKGRAKKKEWRLKFFFWIYFAWQDPETQSFNL